MSENVYSYQRARERAEEILLEGPSALTSDINTKSFPENFKFGVSTSAYQIEGGWKDDGKGPSIWDDYIHENSSVIIDGTNGDIACDSYHRYKEDVNLLKEMGVQSYRFSISWPRILPDGTTRNINQKGIEYYTNLLKLLRKNNIEPIVTLYHWDLPTPLQELGGWLNPDIVSYFGDYAYICYKYFGDYVKYWITINEPQCTCFGGYAGSKQLMPMAPGYSLSAEGPYLCAYTHAKAHALAYHIYQDKFKKKHEGKIALALVGSWYEPATTSEENKAAQELALQFQIGMFANPIFLGNWPKLVIDRVKYRSKKEGFNESRLPSFTQEEIDYINGTYDWIGLNYYSSAIVNSKYQVDDLPADASFTIDEGINTYPNSSWKKNAATPWLSQTPWGLTKLLKWVHDQYNRPEIIITENGWSDDGSTLNDTGRIEYVNLHLSSILDAIYDHNVTVTGYNLWSFLDNFEWSYGYSVKFGVVSVDFKDKNRKRTPKQSFYWYQSIISQRHLNSNAFIRSPTLCILICSYIAAVLLTKFIK